MKAENRALEKYPDYKSMDGGYVTQIKKRKCFVEGYHQVEKDNELTWEDIKIIGELRLNVALELRRKELESPIEAPLKFTTEDMCKEVLKRFKSYGKKEI